MCTLVCEKHEKQQKEGQLLLLLQLSLLSVIPNVQGDGREAKYPKENMAI